MIRQLLQKNQVRLKQTLIVLFKNRTREIQNAFKNASYVIRTNNKNTRLLWCIMKTWKWVGLNYFYFLPDTCRVGVMSLFFLRHPTVGRSIILGWSSIFLLVFIKNIDHIPVVLFIILALFTMLHAIVKQHVSLSMIIFRVIANTISLHRLLNLLMIKLERTYFI